MKLAPSIAKHRSFQAADDADIAYYRSLSPEQRMDILLDLIKAHTQPNEPQERRQRVYRIIKLAES
ncbi:MAG: hypothetical protein ACON5H_00320 [Akkermansiaceae bacterium]